jgi:hypothetical protein
MPPCIDVYLLSKQRNSQTISKFIDEFIDEELSALKFPGQFDLAPDDIAILDKLDNWKTIQVNSVQECINYGIMNPYAAYSIYLHPKSAEFCNVILSFSVDGGIIFGLSLDDPKNEAVKFANAIDYLKLLFDLFDGYEGRIGHEISPPIFPSLKSDSDWEYVRIDDEIKINKISQINGP